MFDDQDLDNLYNFFNKASEQQKRENFKYFAQGLSFGLEKDLNEAFASGNKENYEEILTNIKSNGFKVLRNSQGIHKIEL